MNAVRKFGLASWLIALVLIPGASGQTVTLAQGTATFSQTSPGTYLPASAIDGVTTTGNGWAIYSGGNTDAQTLVFETVTDVGFGGGTQLNFTVAQNEGDYHTLGRFRLSFTTDARSTFADGLSSGGAVTANWTVLSLTSLVSAGGATMTVQGDNSVLVSGTSPLTDTYTFSAVTGVSGITGFRLEAMTDASLPTSGPGRQANGNFVITEFSITATAVPEPGSWTALAGVLVLALAVRRRQSL